MGTLSVESTFHDNRHSNDDDPRVDGVHVKFKILESNRFFSFWKRY